MNGEDDMASPSGNREYKPMKSSCINLRHIGLLLLLLAGTLLAATAQANTAGGTIIHNVATLTFDGGTATAYVDVKVNTIASAPTISVDSTGKSVNGGESATYTYTITNNSNGSDSFSLAAASTDADVSGAPGLNVNGSGTANSAITLGGSVASVASDAAGNIYIPAGSETNLAVGDIVVINGTSYKIATLTAGTAASTTGTTTTPETPTSFTVTQPDGSAAGIVAGTIAVGSQIGEQGSFTVAVTASTPSTAGTDGVHTVNVSGQTTAVSQGAGGAAISYATQTADGNEATTTVLAPTVQLIKEVRNVTQGGQFPSANVTAQSGDTLEYRLTARPSGGSGNSTNSKLVDEIPDYTTYVVNSTTLNNGAVADGAGSSFPLAVANGGIAVKSPSGTAGVIVDGESAVVLFQVTVD